MDIKSVFDTQLAKVNLEALVGVNEIFHLDLKDAGQFTLSITDGKPAMENGLLGAASCVITTDTDTLQGLMNGKTNPMTAMMFGKIKISNIGLIMKYGKLLGIG